MAVGEIMVSEFLGVSAAYFSASILYANGKLTGL